MRTVIQDHDLPVDHHRADLAKPASDPSRSSASDRNSYLDLAKGILIFLVVYGHSIQFAGFAANGMGETARHLDDPVYKAIYLFHMALFIGISGYLARDSVQKRTFLEFNKIRFMQIVVPLLAWSLTFHAATPLVSLLKSRDLSVGLARAAAIPWSQIGAEFWFLWAVLVCGLVVSAVKNLGTWKYPAVIVTFGLLLLLPETEVFKMTKFTFPFFIAGYAISESKISWKIPPLVFFLSLLAAAVIWHFWNRETYAYISGMRWQGNSLNLLLRYAGGITGSIVFLEIVWRCSRKWDCGFLTVWGKASLAIYIIQTYLFIPITGMPHPLRDSKWFGITAAPFLAASICFVCVLASVVLRKNQWLARIYLGVAPKRSATP